MQTKQVEHFEYEKEQQKEDDSLSRLHHGTPAGKRIVDVQTCLDCGRTLLPERGRKRCPRCRGLLISRTTILQAP